MISSLSMETRTKSMPSSFSNMAEPSTWSGRCSVLSWAGVSRWLSIWTGSTWLCCSYSCFVFPFYLHLDFLLHRLGVNIRKGRLRIELSQKKAIKFFHPYHARGHIPNSGRLAYPSLWDYSCGTAVDFHHFPLIFTGSEPSCPLISSSKTISIKLSLFHETQNDPNR